MVESKVMERHPKQQQPQNPAMETTDPPRQGRLLVITGPSGVGKGTLVKQLRQRHPELHFSVSATTRAPRAGEIDGLNYVFCSRQEFLALRESGGLLEWAEYANNLYGTPLAGVVDRLNHGQDVLLEIELSGARQVTAVWPSSVRIFIHPPSMEELERRLRDRGQDSEASIERRLAQATTELQAVAEFDYIIVNDDVPRALAELERILYG